MYRKHTWNSLALIHSGNCGTSSSLASQGVQMKLMLNNISPSDCDVLFYVLCNMSCADFLQSQTKYLMTQKTTNRLLLKPLSVSAQMHHTDSDWLIRTGFIVKANQDQQAGRLDDKCEWVQKDMQILRMIKHDKTTDKPTKPEQKTDKKNQKTQGGLNICTTQADWTVW